jgi:hypothetical protein
MLLSAILQDLAMPSESRVRRDVIAEWQHEPQGGEEEDERGADGSKFRIGTQCPKSERDARKQ